MRDVLFVGVPAPMRDVVSQKAKEMVREGLLSQGIARFTAVDRLQRLTKDLDVLAQVLGQKPFLFGDRPSAADAAIAPVLDMILRLPVATELRQATEAHAGFAPYVTRVRAAIYPSMDRSKTATAAE